VFESNFSTFTYGPVVDGSFMPAQAGQLLRDGAFDHSVKVMTGHNAAEGLIFGDPKVNTSDSFSAWLEGVYPNIAAIAADYIENTLYPPVFDGSFGYSDQFERTAAILAEQIFTCNDYFLNRAFGNQTYACMYSLLVVCSNTDLVLLAR
jgi:carboxylesterase type B